MQPLHPLLVVTTVCVLVAAAPAPAADCTAEPLDILLTNDDGFETGGIRALYTALSASGHRVKLIAPNVNFSGSSASLTLSKISVTTDANDANIHAVEGSPATTVLLGVTAAGRSGSLQIASGKGEI